MRVNDLNHPARRSAFCGCASRPYDDAALRALAERIRPLEEPVYVYFRHEDDPPAPAYALRLLELLD